ncbi:MAG TPA: hypothetical protein VJ725_29880, partial [Thermoanaerobaculia bacterium]|nr:hypothetical protein [Thermoanaerobaculia bacterium]
VAFTSSGLDFVAGVTDTNKQADLFLWDRLSDTTTLISHAAGQPDVTADGRSRSIRISADGNYVVFTSWSKNLVAGQTEPNPPRSQFTEGLFLWHRLSGTLTLVSRKSGSTATMANDGSGDAEISADGSFVVFTSLATDLIAGLADGDGTADVFLYQRSSGAISLISRASGSPLTAAGASSSARISANGRFIAFASGASNLVPGQVDTASPDAFLFDRTTGEIRLASRTNASPKIAGGISSPIRLSLSGDGRYLAFASRAPNLVPGQVDTNGQDDLFVYDRIAGTTALVSRSRVSPTTATADPAAGAGALELSADGRFIAFESTATDLVSGQTDSPSTSDIFLYDRIAKTTVLVSRAGASATTVANRPSREPVISPDGSVVAFHSLATDFALGQADANGFTDLFLYRRGAAEVEHLSLRDPGSPALTPLGPSSVHDLSADGRFAVFLSRANGLIPGQIEASGFESTWDVFLRDRTTGKTTLIRPPGLPLRNLNARSAVLSADGRFVAFVNVQSPPYTYRLFLHDLSSDTFTLVNHKPDSPDEPSGWVETPVMSADGRYIAFTCRLGCDLVAGGSPGNPEKIQVFLYDRVTGTTTLVSHANSSPLQAGDGDSYLSEISADGRFVAFSSEATNLVAGQTDPLKTGDAFLFDQTTGSITLVSHTPASATTSGNSHSWISNLSPDGRFVAFGSLATDLLPGQIDTPETRDLFLWDRLSGTRVLVSHASGAPGTAANGETSSGPESSSMSADGRWIVFTSLATNLVAGVTDTNGGTPFTGNDIFLYDRIAGTSTLISHAHGAPATACNLWAVRPALSPDGSRIAFLSPATDLVAGQPADEPLNLFLQDRATGASTLVGMERLSIYVRNDEAGVSVRPRFSADGRFLAFTSRDPDLVAGDYNDDWDAFLYDPAGGTITVPPCTLFDTRRPADGPALRSGARKVLTVHGACGVPATATAVTVRVSVIQPNRRGSLGLFPGNATTPAALLRFQKGPTRTGSFTVPLGAGTLALQPTVAGNGTIHVALEIVGYQ